MIRNDGRGLLVSTSNTRNIERYEEALRLLHGYYGDPLAVIDAALGDDPDFLMGHALRGALFVASTEKRAVKPLQQAVDCGKALIRRGLGTARERQHIAALDAWAAGDFIGSTDRYNRLVNDQPRDALAVQISHLCNFYLGKTSWLRDHVALALPHYAAEEFSYSYLLGMHAFGLEENNEYLRAERAGQQALELNARDPWAVHALAHVHEMRGETRAGVELLEARREAWAPDNMFAIHNWWHLALFYLETGAIDHVLELYDDPIRGSKSEVNLDLVDASALLWRLYTRGIDVNERFAELAAAWESVEEEQYYAFNDLHALMAYAGAGRERDVQRVILGVEAKAREAEPGTPWREVGLPTCRGFAAFARGDYAAALDELFGVRPFAQRFGGSNAQRDILDWTLIEAATRAGQHSLGRSLVQARALQKPYGLSPLGMRLRIERSELTATGQVRAA